MKSRRKLLKNHQSLYCEENNCESYIFNDIVINQSKILFKIEHLLHDE